MSHSEEDRGQHYIQCARCTNYSKFYCNNCHQRMCEQHRDIHLQEEKNTKHAVVLYQERIQELPTEKCLVHPKRDLEIYCNECQLPICSKCFTIDHNSHKGLDLEVVYNECLQQRQIELIEYRDTILPQSVESLKSWRDRVEKVKKEITMTRTYMKMSADTIKAAVDIVLDEGNSKLDKMEISILDGMKSTEKEIQEYISHLQTLVKTYEKGTLLSEPSDVFTFCKEIADIPSMKIPDTTEPVLPEFINGTIAKKELERQFGNLKQRDPKTHKGEEKQIHQTSQPRMMLTSSIMKIKEITLPQLKNIKLLSFSPSEEVWASDNTGNLVQCDLQGNVLQEFTNMLTLSGSHTVTCTTEGELLYTDYQEKAIHRLSRNMALSSVITTEDWEPGGIYSSHINGDILVGMYGDGEWRMTRYSKKGEKLQDIQKNDRGQDLYRTIYFITENINADICVSDSAVKKVVVVTWSGHYRFSYSGHPSQPGFSPSGICTNALGHILVCSDIFHYRMMNIPCGIHMLDQDGQHLTFLLTSPNPRGVCNDDKQNVWVWFNDSPTVKVYKCLEIIDI